MGGVTAISAGLTAQAMRCMDSELDIAAPRLFSPSNPSTLGQRDKSTLDIECSESRDSSGVDGLRDSSRLPHGRQDLGSTPFGSLDSGELPRLYRCWSSILLHFCLSRGVTTLDSAIIG